MLASDAFMVVVKGEVVVGLEVSDLQLARGHIKLGRVVLQYVLDALFIGPWSSVLATSFALQGHGVIHKVPVMFANINHNFSP